MIASRIATNFVLAVLLAWAHVGAVERSELLPLPLPDLSEMGEAARERLELLQVRVADLKTSASDGELAEAYGTLGKYYIAHHLNDAAEVALFNASLLAPDDFRWAYYLGFVYQMVGKLELERDAFERALALRPEYVPAHLRLAELLLALGENEEAIDDSSSPASSARPRPQPSAGSAGRRLPSTDQRRRSVTSRRPSSCSPGRPSSTTSWPSPTAGSETWRLRAPTWSCAATARSHTPIL